VDRATLNAKNITIDIEVLVIARKRVKGHVPVEDKSSPKV
jgi:hypothetical protein